MDDIGVLHMSLFIRLVCGALLWLQLCLAAFSVNPRYFGVTAVSSSTPPSSQWPEGTQQILDVSVVHHFFGCQLLLAKVFSPFQVEI